MQQALVVLVVEDERIIAKDIESTLKQAGYKVPAVVSSGDEAIALAAIMQPDLILMDIVLRGEPDGIETAKRIHSQFGTPIIYLTAYADQSFLERARHTEPIGYIVKPFNEKELIAAIELGLHQYRIQRQRAKEELRKSEERFSSAFEYAAIGMALVAQDGHLLKVNQSLCNILGYTADDFTGRKLQEFTHPEDMEIDQELIRQLLAGEVYTYQIEKRFINKLGRTLIVLLSVSVVKDQGGIPLYLIAQFQDFTERKHAEEALRNSEEKFRRLVTSAPDAVFGVDENGKIIFANAQASILLGYSFEEFIGREIEMLVPTASRDIHVWNRADYVNRPSARFMGTVLEISALRKDGTEVPVDITLGHFESESGMLVIAFMRDVTERRRAAEALASRERYLALLNDMTHTILLASELAPTLQSLALDMKKLLGADHCSIAEWDEVQQRSIAITSSMSADVPVSKLGNDEMIAAIISAVMQSAHALAINDVDDSPFGRFENNRRAHDPVSILAVPLIVGSHKLGVVLISFEHAHLFTTEEIERAEQAANQVALALWDFQQGANIQKRLKESTAMAKISRALSASERVGLGEVLQLIVDAARELMPNAEKSVIHLLDMEAQVLIPRAVSGFDEHEKESSKVQMGLGEGVAGRVIREGITINTGDILSNPNFLLSYASPRFRSLLVAPVQSSGKQIGTISLQSVLLNAFSAEDTELLNALAVQAAIAIENTSLIESIQQRLKVQNALYGISRELASTLDTSELLKHIVNLLIQHFDYYHAQVFLLDPATRDLVLREASGKAEVQLLTPGYRLPPGSGIVGYVVESALPFLTNNLNDAFAFPHNPLLPNVQSELAVPMQLDGRVIGVLDVQNTPPRQLTDDDLHLMTAIADQLSVALQKADLYASLQTSLEHEQAIRSQLVQSERLALMGRLLASVSHELNNPLQALHTALYLLKDEEQLSAAGRENLEILLGEAERMADLVKRLRSAYRPLRSKDFQAVQINKKVEDVKALTATLMRHKEIHFEFIRDPDLPLISAIPDQIRQVILNLFINAIEVINPGGTLTVRTQYLPEQREVLLTVKDTGPGIDPAILPRIFDAFITNKNTGTGLGLTITHDIIHQHHGRIEAENDPQGGAIFKVSFKVKEKSSP